jgi:hypothetical protein
MLYILNGSLPSFFSQEKKRVVYQNEQLIPFYLYKKIGPLEGFQGREKLLQSFPGNSIP